MNTPAMCNSVLAAVLFSTICAVSVRAQQLSGPAREVWAMEERYWNDVKSLNVEDFLSLWHDDFKGWPASSNAPIPKDSAADMIRVPLSRGSRITRYELHRKVLQVFGNTAISIYAVTFTWVDNHGHVERTGQWYKLIHTWLKVGKEWKIIGSLSAVLAQPDSPPGH